MCKSKKKIIIIKKTLHLKEQGVSRSSSAERAGKRFVRMDEEAKVFTRGTGSFFSHRKLLKKNTHTQQQR